MSDTELLIDIRDPQAINAIGRTITEILTGFAADIHTRGVAYIDHLKPENLPAVKEYGCVSPVVNVTLEICCDYSDGTVQVHGAMNKPYMRPVYVNNSVTRKAIDNTPGK